LISKSGPGTGGEKINRRARRLCHPVELVEYIEELTKERGMNLSEESTSEIALQLAEI